MGDVRQALKMQREAQRKRALAPVNDQRRRDFDLQWADGLETDALAMLQPEHLSDVSVCETNRGT